jgi:enoyl-CoA hydratase/carnithine racemase
LADAGALVERRGKVMIITINRPEARNAKERPLAFADKRQPVWRAK